MSSPEPELVGMLLLTGGEGRRLGGPKHRQPHPEGGSWAGHLVRVFQAVFPEGPICVLGFPVPEHADLPIFEDPHQGPARAMVVWAAAPLPRVTRWWVVACDQVRWTPARLAHWHRKVVEADPGAEAWVMGEQEGRRQFLGGFLGERLLPLMATAPAQSMWELSDRLPGVSLAVHGPEWLDVDSPEDMARWKG